MRNEAEVAAMQCPVCRVPLAMSDRQGIEIDYCPQCRGVWLDRGELDKIIERSAPPAAETPPASAPQPSAPLHQAGGQGGLDHGGYGHGGRGDRGYSQHGGGKPYKKRNSWLEDIFD